MRHYYYITDENNNVVFRNINFACFQEILQPSSICQPAFNENLVEISQNSKALSVLLDFLKGKKIHILIDPKVTKEKAENFARNLETIFGKYCIQNLDRPLSSIWDIEKSPRVKEIFDIENTLKHVVSINFDDFKSPHYFKFALYFLRAFNEQVFTIDKLNEFDGSVDFFQWIRIVYSELAFPHNYFSIVRNRYSGDWIPNIVKEEFFGDRFESLPYETLATNSNNGIPRKPFNSGDTIRKASANLYNEYWTKKKEEFLKAEPLVVKKKRKSKPKQLVAI